MTFSQDQVLIGGLLAFGTAILNVVQAIAFEYFRRKYPSASDKKE